MRIEDLQNQIIEIKETISSHEEKFNSTENLHKECKNLQKERLENTTIAIGNIKDQVDNFHNEIKFNITALTNEQNTIKSNLNIVTSNVKEVLDFKNKINERISKLVIAIITAILLALTAKVIEKLFDVKSMEAKYLDIIEGKANAEPDIARKPVVE